jgi:hypothetical protein
MKKFLIIIIVILLSAKAYGADAPEKTYPAPAQRVYKDIYRYRDAAGVIHLSNLPGAKLKQSYPAPTPEQQIKANNQKLTQMSKKMELVIRRAYPNQFQTTCYAKDNLVFCRLRFPGNYSIGNVPQRYLHEMQEIAHGIAIAFRRDYAPSFWIQPQVKVGGDYDLVGNYIYDEVFDSLQVMEF